MTQLTENVFAVEVPEGAKDIYYEVSMSGTPYIAYKFNDDELLNEYEDIVLPPGNWQFICTTKDITEKQAKGIVGSSEWYFPERHIRYIDYNHLVGPDGKQAWNIGFSNALLSLRSLLASKGLDVNKNYCLLKKVG